MGSKNAIVDWSISRRVINTRNALIEPKITISGDRVAKTVGFWRFLEQIKMLGFSIFRIFKSCLSLGTLF